MSRFPIATTSINTGSSGLHHADVLGRPHGGGSSSNSITYLSFHFSAPGGSSSPSFPLPVHSPSSAASSSAPTARQPHGRRGLRLKDSQNMAAVRPKLAVLPSGGAAYARSMTESSSAADFLDLKSPESPVAGSMPAKPKGKIPQPNVKKMRRRVALLSGVHLNLPNSPVVGPSPPGTARELAWTFTAEWDSTQDEFIFSDLDSSSSSGGSSSGLSSASTRFFRNNPVPCDVNEDDAFSPLAKLSICSRLQELASASASSSSSSSSASSSASTSPSSPAVSDIFDLYTSTPSTHSFSFSDSNDSSSSASSSPVDTSSPSSYTDSQFDPPVISVTFYEDEASQRVTVDRMVVAPASAFEPISWEPLLVQKSRSLPQTPQSAGVPKIRRSRPLPPVPVRTSSRA